MGSKMDTWGSVGPDSRLILYHSLLSHFCIILTPRYTHILSTLHTPLFVDAVPKNACPTSARTFLLSIFRHWSVCCSGTSVAVVRSKDCGPPDWTNFGPDQTAQSGLHLSVTAYPVLSWAYLYEIGPLYMGCISCPRSPGPSNFPAQVTHVLHP
jgi:hypothetical protein